jgi:hypothetical protein
MPERSNLFESHWSNQWLTQNRVIDSIVAVRVGFEPTEPAKVQRFSRPPDSTTLAPHRVVCIQYT